MLLLILSPRNPVRRGLSCWVKVRRNGHSLRAHHDRPHALFDFFIDTFLFDWWRGRKPLATGAFEGRPSGHLRIRRKQQRRLLGYVQRRHLCRCGQVSDAATSRPEHHCECTQNSVSNICERLNYVWQIDRSKATTFVVGASVKCSEPSVLPVQYG